jgi:hypothetical protein
MTTWTATGTRQQPATGAALFAAREWLGLGEGPQAVVG